MSLVPIASLGDQLGVPVTAIRAFIHLASLLHQRDYWAEGRTVDRLGLDRHDRGPDPAIGRGGTSGRRPAGSKYNGTADPRGPKQLRRTPMTSTKADRFGLVRPAVDAHTLGISSVGQLLQDCGYASVTADAATCEACGRPDDPEATATVWNAGSARTA